MKKIVGIIISMLLFCTTLSTISGVAIIEKKTTISPYGITLNVGGSGPGNYTSIQKAINEANIGDTVFVYDDSSPYYTSARIKQSINLIGEDKDTTILRNIIDFVVNISANNVLIKGFTIESSGKGIIVNSNYNTITNNIITNFDGIHLMCSNSNIIQGNEMNNPRDSIRLENSNDNSVKENEIKSGRYAIWLENTNGNVITKNNISGKKTGILTSRGGEGNIISHNRITDSEKGICLKGDRNNIVAYNYLSNNHEGIYLTACYKTNITNNMIASSTYHGLASINCMYIEIFRNTFIDNEENAYFCLNFKSLWPLHQKSLNKWKNNFWEEPQKFSYTIYGKVFYRRNFPLLKKEIEFNFTWINIDWHPAKEPYDI